uniref:GRAM domain containing 2A n=1 Tax=Ficedula albicollis TaxID=59894 RepID=A0A803VBV4_FICAL
MAQPSPRAGSSNLPLIRRGSCLQPAGTPQRRSRAASKYNSQYHKLFKDIPTEESVLKVCSCALQRDILIQGRLYISPNWLCFYANLFGKDIKVVIPVVSVQLIKKHKTARLLPNGLAITTTASRKYIFVSLISRDSVYDVLRRVCTHLQVPPLCVPLCVHGPEALHLPFGLSTALHHCLQGSGLLPKPSPIPSILTAARDGKRGRSHALGTSCPRGLFWVMDEAEL